MIPIWCLNFARWSRQLKRQEKSKCLLHLEQLEDRLAPAAITLFNTGMSASRILLTDGTIGDPHFTLVSVPGGTTDLRIRTSAGGYPFPLWVGDDALSTWIGPNNDVSCDGPVGDYDFRTTFDLTGLIPSTASISGLWTSDNQGLGILINGQSTGNSDSGGNTYASFHSFSISSGFQPGLNTLDFLVYNTDDNVGLRVEMTGTATAKPRQRISW